MGISRRQSGGMRATSVVALALFAAGCSALGGSKGPPPTYDLSTPTQFPGLRAPRGQLVVQGATALGPLDSDKIVVRPSPGELQALADAQWVDGLTRLVQVRLIQTFENARRLRAVGRPTDRIVADYQLLLDIRAFEISRRWACGGSDDRGEDRRRPFRPHRRRPRVYRARADERDAGRACARRAGCSLEQCRDRHRALGDADYLVHVFPLDACVISVCSIHLSNSHASLLPSPVGERVASTADKFTQSAQA